ncbi:unnamed protein product [Ectocarpus sp. 13 AM-2016]
MKFFVAVTTCLTACFILNNGSASAFLAPTRTLIVPSAISSSCAVRHFDPVSSRRPEHVISIPLPSFRRGTAAEAALALPEVASGLQDELRRLCATKSEAGREARIQEVAKELNALNPTKDPARSPLLAGRWRMLYSTVPGPSSGRLGPFVGDVFQDICPDEKRSEVFCIAMIFCADSRVVSFDYGDLPRKRSYAVRRFWRVLVNAVPKTVPGLDGKALVRVYTEGRECCTLLAVKSKAKHRRRGG